MKAVRLENFRTKTPPGKSAEEWRRKKKNLTNTGWSSAPAESGESGGKDTGAAGTPPERRPTYSETMQGYYGDRRRYRRRDGRAGRAGRARAHPRRI